MESDTCGHLIYQQAEEDFLARLTQEFPDDSMDRDDVEDVEDESDESEEEEEQRRGKAKQNGTRRSRGTNSPVERRTDVVSTVKALQQKGEVEYVVSVEGEIWNTECDYGLDVTGMSGPLLWLQSCLNRTADDRQHDGEFNSHISVFHCMDMCVCVFKIIAWFSRFVLSRASGPSDWGQWRRHGEQEFPQAAAQTGFTSSCKRTGVCLCVCRIIL